MALTLQAQTRVVVIPVAIGTYDTPQGADAARGCAFDALPRVGQDVALLQDLFTSAPHYRDAGFELLPTIGGRADTIIGALADLKTLLRQRPDVTVLLFWSGHGRTVRNELRLVTQECVDPIDASDGLSPGQVIGPLADAQVRALFVLLDVCQASAASAELITSAAARAFERTPESSFVFGALFSAYPFEAARDGFFVPQLERLLREGPSAAAQAATAREQWESFGLHTRMLSLSEVQEALAVEIDLLKATQPTVPTPAGVHLSARAARVFPNPLYQRDAPPRNVEQARRRLLQADVDTHFLPKARGLEPGEDGWFFTGRTQVTHDIVDWLRRPAAPAAAQRLFVLSGDGGTGKSAVIGRLAMLSDDAWRGQARKLGWNEAADQAADTAPAPQSIDAALHLRARTAQQAAVALGDMLGRPVADVAQLVADAGARARRNASEAMPTIVLDALDEADEPGTIATSLVLPLVAAGWRVLVATRPRAANASAVDLLAALGPAERRNLDTDADTNADIAHYVQQRLVAAAVAYPAAAAAAIAAAIAERAAGKFLYARIAVGALLRRTGPPLDAARIGAWLGVDLYHALQRELEGLDAAFGRAHARSDAGASALLAALAWSEGAGLPLRDGLWPLVAQAIGDAPFDAAHVAWLLREGGRFIVESGDGEQAVYRLYHQSLVDHFRVAQGGTQVAARVAAALEQAQSTARQSWADANPYLVRHLPAHLAVLADSAPLQRLLLDAAWTAARLTDGGISALLLDQERCADPPPALQAIGRALRRSAHALAGDTQQLPAQLLARLMALSTPGVAPFLATLQGLQHGPWLRPLIASLAGERSVRSMRGEGGASLSAVSMSRNGLWAAYEHSDGVMLLDLQSWTSCGVIFKPPSSAFALALSDDARACVAADSIGSVHHWQADDERLRGGPAHSDLSIALLLGLDSTGRYGLSATTASERRLIAWDFAADTHTVLPDESGDSLDNVPSALLLDRAGHRAWLGTADGTVRWLQIRPWRELGRFNVSGRPLALAQTPDASRIAVAASDGVVEVRAVATPQPVLFSLNLTEQPRSVALSDDGLRLAVGTERGTVEVWDLARGQRSAHYAGAHTYEVRQMVFRGGGQQLVSADGLHVKQWDSQAADAPPPAQRVISDLAGPKNGTTVYALLADGQLGRWTLATATAAAPLPAAPLLATEWKGLYHAAAAPRLLAWAESGMVAWDLKEGVVLGMRPAQQLKAAAISADGRCMVCVEDSEVIAWWPDSGRSAVIGRYQNGESPRAVTITPDGKRVLSCGGDRFVHAWLLQAGEDSLEAVASFSVTAREKPARVDCVHTNAAVVVSGGGELSWLDTRAVGFASARPLGVRHDAFVNELLPFGDGRRFATSSFDATVRLWDLAQGNHPAVLSAHPGTLQQIAPAAGRMLVSTFTGILKVLSMRDGALLAAFQADKQIVSAFGDAELRSIAAVDQGGGMHFLHLEGP